jgi:hypothetical protein
MSERIIEPNDRFFLAAIHGGPYLVIADGDVHGFRTYSAAESFAKNLTRANPAKVIIARVIFRSDGTPYRMKCFPTPFADSSFERARREFGL